MEVEESRSQLGVPDTKVKHMSGRSRMRSSITTQSTTGEAANKEQVTKKV